MTDHLWQDYAAPYALGALAAEDRNAFEAHLAGCDTCRAEVRAFSEVAGLLPTAPAVELPPVLRARVLAEAARAAHGETSAWRAGRVARRGSRSAARDRRRRRAWRPRSVDESALALSDNAARRCMSSRSRPGRPPTARVLESRERRFIVLAHLPAASWPHVSLGDR
jgi:anti-sigma factor RsiW